MCAQRAHPKKYVGVTQIQKHIQQNEVNES